MSRHKDLKDDVECFTNIEENCDNFKQTNDDMTKSDAVPTSSSKIQSKTQMETCDKLNATPKQREKKRLIPGEKLEKITEHLKRTKKQRTMIEQALEIKHTNMLTSLRKKEKDNETAVLDNLKPSASSEMIMKQNVIKPFSISLSKMNSHTKSDEKTTPNSSSLRTKAEKNKERTIPNILSKSTRHKTFSAPLAQSCSSIKYVSPDELQATENRMKTNKSETKQKLIATGVSMLSTTQIKTEGIKSAQSPTKTTVFPGSVPIASPRSFPYIKIMGNSITELRKSESGLDKEGRIEKPTNELDTGKVLSGDSETNNDLSTKTQFTHLQPKNQKNQTSPGSIVQITGKKIAWPSKTPSFVSNNSNAPTITESKPTTLGSPEIKYKTKSKVNIKTSTNVVTYAEFCAQMDSDKGVTVPTVPQISKFNTPASKSTTKTAVTYAEYCAQMDAVEERSRKTCRIKPEDDKVVDNLEYEDGSDYNEMPNLDDNASKLLTKLSNFHIESSKSSDATDTKVDVNSISQASSVSEIKTETEEDIDVCHLSDHGYTLTPNSSPTKHQADKSIQSQAEHSSVGVSIPMKQTPVYAVKYGNKLFLIPSNDRRPNTSASVTNKDCASLNKTCSEQVVIKSPCNANKSKIRSKNGNKSDDKQSKKRADFFKRLSLLQKTLKKSKKSSVISFRPKHANKQYPVQRYAKVVHIFPKGAGFNGVVKRISVTLTRGSDPSIKRWQTYTDFQVRLTYEDDKCTLKHIEADSLASGFYRIIMTTAILEKTVLATMSYVPPHQDVLSEGEHFVAIGPMFSVFDAAINSDVTHIKCKGQIQAYLSAILPKSNISRLGITSSDDSYRPKDDARMWYSSRYFDYFTRKMFQNKRNHEKRPWDYYHTRMELQ